jgi:ATP-binding cassette subfamily F protein uup
MKDFLFPAAMIKTPISLLSGGERGRLMLARALAIKSNLLVLDEPTNDLDLETLDLLQEILCEYKGTLILVSHDRDFVDRVASSVLTVDQNGEWFEYAGGYSDMVLQRGIEAESMHTPGRQNNSKVQQGKKPGISSSVKQEVFSGNMQKITYKEKYNLEKASQKIDDLVNVIAKLESVISEPGFYSRDPNGFIESSKNLETAKQELSETEEKWLALELRSERGSDRI